MPPARRRGRGGGGGELAAALAAIRRGEAAPLYFLHGEEAFLRDEFLRALRAAVLEEGGGDFNHDRFDWAPGKAPDVVAAAQTLPFMSPRRLIEVRGIENVGEEDAALFFPLFADLPPTSVLVLIAERADMRKTFFRRLREAGRSVALDPPGEREIPAWLCAQAEALGFSLHGEAAALLVEMVDPSLGRLRTELEKLAAYVGTEGAAGVEEVRDLVGRSKVEALYRLNEALAAGSASRALGLVHQLTESEPPPVLIGLLRNQVRRWTIAKAAGRKRIPAQELAGILRVPPYSVNRILKEVERVSGRFLRGLYGRLLAADRRIKRAGSDGAARQALDLFVMEACRAPDGFGRRRG
ncbi:MAG: DNA polymerase III subunit delta [bacterium]